MFWKKNRKKEEPSKVQNEPASQLEKEKVEPNQSLSAKQIVTDFNKKFSTRLDEIKKIAQSDLENWHSFLTKWEINPATSAQKEAAKSSGLPLPKVAFPSEYRKVLEKVQFETRTEVNELQERVKDDFDADDLLDEFIRRKLNSLVDDELNRYLDESKPAVSVSDIFANASTSMNKYSVQEKDMGDKSYSIKCKTCGAARLEEDQYDNCFYCGSPLFQ